jgi:hypothetical protein
VGSPADVKSPRTGSATIWAACLPTDHPSFPSAPRPAGCPFGCPFGWVAAPAAGLGGPLPLPAAAPPPEGRLRNQSDVAALTPATGPAFGTPAFGTPTFEIAVFEMPVFEMPGFEMPGFEMPEFELIGSRAPVTA